MTASAQGRDASDVLERWYAAWNAHDVNAVGALVTDDVRYEDPAAHANVLNGRGPVEGHVRAAFLGLPDLHLEKLEEWISPGGAVIASYFRVTATFSGVLEAPGLPPLAPTNGPIDLLGMDRSEIRDGRLARHQIFWDTGELTRQIGVLPPRGSAMERLSRRLQHLTARRMRKQTAQVALGGA
jgi:ketosteroid isomerase-like protein